MSSGSGLEGTGCYTIGNNVTPWSLTLAPFRNSFRVDPGPLFNTVSEAYDRCIAAGIVCVAAALP